MNVTCLLLTTLSVLTVTFPGQHVQLQYSAKIHQVITHEERTQQELVVAGADRLNIGSDGVRSSFKNDRIQQVDNINLSTHGNFTSVKNTFQDEGGRSHVPQY